MFNKCIRFVQQMTTRCTIICLELEGVAMSFAEFFIRRMGELNINQSDVARELNLAGHEITRAAVSAWATGRRIPDIRNVAFRRSLARILHVDTQTLLSVLGYDMTLEHTPEAREIAEMVDSLPADLRRLAVDMVRTLQRAGG
jgi:transcriptional regulator with XRE-family HTH domain